MPSSRRRRRERAHGALRRDGARRALRLHPDRAGSPEATVEQFYERAVVEKPTQESGSLADEYIRNFTQQEPIPGHRYEYALHRRFLPEITVARSTPWRRTGCRIATASSW
jgi:hypothetical protein